MSTKSTYLYCSEKIELYHSPNSLPTKNNKNHRPTPYLVQKGGGHSGAENSYSGHQLQIVLFLLFLAGLKSGHQ